ncbi:MAG: glutamate-5-semialdehyde dehydrogenase, partial [Nitrospirales bacterium]
VESIALCLKSGNVCVMRAGSDWARTNSVVGQALLEAADKTGVPTGAISLIERPEREAALELLRMPKLVDAIIPRGGLPLRTVVMEQSRVPVLCHDGGVCSMYVDGEADLPLAQTLVVNGKVQQATAVNSVDTVLVHHGIARSLIPGLARRLLDDFKVDVKGCPKTVAMIGAQEFAQYKTVIAASEEDWSRQFVSTVLAVKVVKDMDEALDHIGRYGPSQTSTIVTRNYEAALRFTRAVDASAVLVNASTRFHEGPELGVGRAFGLSTSRLHARGPITLEDLTCQKYVVMGNGQLRQPHPVPTPYEDAIMLKRPS